MMAIQRSYSVHNLSALMAGIQDVTPEQDQTIQGVAIDSRKVSAGDLFFACAGTQVHGKEFIQQAINQGAAAILLEPDETLVDQHDLTEHYGVPVMLVPGLSQHVGEIAERFYGCPTDHMTVVGVTGTNGKTSCSHFIAQALSEDTKCGVIGTLGNGLYGELETASHTTPDAVSMHALLADMYERDAQTTVMEVSSHGLDQGRVDGVAFDVAVFTNLSHEHLDYHQDMTAYGAAKQRLFDRPGLRYAVINVDDAFGRQLLHSLPAGVHGISYGLEEEHSPMVKGSELQLGSQGLSMHITSPWGEGHISNQLLGRFNASNLLAAFAVLLVLKQPFADVMQKLSSVNTVAGRMERFGDEAQPMVVVDYAHTPDALEQVLQALREHCRHKLWCVFGCGGNRDTSKRPLMGEIAVRFADQIVITDDNPRHEDGDQIVADIVAGIKEQETIKVMRDRREAIDYAISNAQTDDVVLIAGKGHEDYQLVGDESLPFSDSKLVDEVLGKVKG